MVHQPLETQNPKRIRCMVAELLPDGCFSRGRKSKKRVLVVPVLLVLVLNLISVPWSISNGPWQVVVVVVIVILLLFLCLFVCFVVCLLVCLFVCLFVCMFVCLFV